MKKTRSSDVFLYKPKSVNQDAYLNLLNNDYTKIVLAIGPAGTGKTLFACQKAITLLKSEEISKIIITRPVVTVEEEIGFLPGNLIKKMDPWTRPIFDIFLEHYSRVELDMMLNNGKIEICPLAFMRGRTFKNAFIVADEMQNSSPNQMKMLTTRIGDGCKMVITGDLNQTDILKGNGLQDLMSKWRHYELYNRNCTNMINGVLFDNNDVERSEIVKHIIEIYDFKTEEEIMDDVRLVKNQNHTKNLADKNITNHNETYDSKSKKYVLFNNTPSGNSNSNSDAALIPTEYVTKNYNKFLDSMKNF
jgi:phosphate starvation-inducible PhoH-like protein